jgi:hypothetical protein
MRGGTLLRTVVAVGVGLTVSLCAWSAPDTPHSPPPLAHLGLVSQPVPLPGVGQIIFVFICVAALAVGVAALLRRYGPALGLLPGLQPSSGVVVTVLARQKLEPGVSLHVVNIGGERVAIVTSRSGVAVHTLAAGEPGANSTTRPGDPLK